MDSKRAKRLLEYVSSLAIDSSRTDTNSVNVRWSVCRDCWGMEGPKREVNAAPSFVGWPGEVSKRPRREAMV